MGPLLWVARSVLIGAVLAHIWVSLLLAIENRKARPIGYEVNKSIRTSIAGRTMMISGILVLAFLVYHLLHFTFRTTHPDISYLVDSLGRHDVYSMVVLSFQNIWISGSYCVAMILLCFHLSHGASSWLQSLGWNNEKLEPLFSRVGLAFAVVMTIGYLSIPVSVWCGWVQPASGVGS